MILVKKLNGEQDTGMKKKRTKRAISLLGKRRRKGSLPHRLFCIPRIFLSRFYGKIWLCLRVTGGKEHLWEIIWREEKEEEITKKPGNLCPVQPRGGAVSLKEINKKCFKLHSFSRREIPRGAFFWRPSHPPGGLLRLPPPLPMQGEEPAEREGGREHKGFHARRKRWE